MHVYSEFIPNKCSVYVPENIGYYGIILSAQLHKNYWRLSLLFMHKY